MRVVPRPVSGFNRAAIAIAALAAVSAAASAAGPPEPAPRFNAKTLDGERFTNENLKGKVVLIQFWATWCRYCRNDQEIIDDLVKEFGGKGLVVLAVNAGEPRKKVRQYLADSPRLCKIVLMTDTNLAAMFNAQTYPYYVLIDRGGNVAGIQRGSGGEAPLRRLLAKAGLASE